MDKCNRELLIPSSLTKISDLNAKKCVSLFIYYAHFIIILHIYSVMMVEGLTFTSEVVILIHR